MRVKYFYFVSTLFVVLFFIGGCAGRAYLIVDYMVTPRSQYLKGQSVSIQVEDLRKSKAVMEPRALRAFPDFRNRYSLAWVMPNRQRILAGEHDLAELFEQTFKKRLERLGVNVVQDTDPSIPVFKVSMNTVRIKLIGVKWYAAVSCTAGLLVNERRVSGETVTGNAERVRVIGRKGADIVLSNIFTDVVNRIDVVKLFQQAKLI
jgi:hypothetical protein